MQRNGTTKHIKLTVANGVSFRLRIHDTQEWHDLYQKSTNDDLQLFFDKYAKGIDNAWEKTPKVRVSLLGYNLVGCHELI